MKPVLQSFIEYPFAGTGRRAPRGSFVSAAPRSRHPLEDIVLASAHLAASAAAQLFLRQSAAVFDSSSPGQGTFVGLGDVLCWILTLLPCALPLPGGHAPTCPGGQHLCLGHVFPACWP